MNLHTHNINNPLTLAPLAMSKLAASNVVSPAKQQTRRGVRQPSWRRYGGGEKDNCTYMHTDGA